MKIKEKIFFHKSIPYIEVLFRWIAGVIFISAGIPKILNPEEFSNAIANYNVLPGFLVPFTAIVLPWLECLCGLCLLIKKYVNTASLILSLLIVGFIIGITVNLVRGDIFECGCFSFLFDGEIGISIIARDLLLLVAVLSTLFLNNLKQHPAAATRKKIRKK